MCRYQSFFAAATRHVKCTNAWTACVSEAFRKIGVVGLFPGVLLAVPALALEFPGQRIDRAVVVANTLGVELGNGTANNTRTALNPAVARTSPYAWWVSSAVGNSTLTAPASAGDTNVKVSSVASYYVGGTINVDTGDGGDRLESRTAASSRTTLPGPDTKSM